MALLHTSPSPPYGARRPNGSGLVVLGCALAGLALWGVAVAVGWAF